MAMLVGKQKRQDALRLLVRRVLLGGLVAVVAAVLLYTAFRRWTYFGLPADEGPPLPGNVKTDVREEETRISLGDCWLAREGGLWRIHLRGDPRTLGHCHGMLVNRILEPLERRLETFRRTSLPGTLQRWWFGNRLRWQLRSLMETVHPYHLAELAAFARTVVDTEELSEGTFQRLIYYHALPDVLQARLRKPLFQSAAFAVWGKQTGDGRMLVGRSMELGLGRIFDRDRALLIVRGRDRIPFASLAWPGTLGVLSGVNAEHVFVALVPVRTSVGVSSGTPGMFLVRQILEQARSLKDALKIVKESQPLGTWAMLIADGRARTAAIVELTPKQLLLRNSAKGVLALTNHLLHKKLQADASNDWLRRYTPSEARYKRLTQLLSRFAGRIDPATAALVLRNRTGLNDAPLALGHRAAVDTLRASHGLVVDVSSLVLWVPQSPHLLGPMIAVDLKRAFGRVADANAVVPEIGADPLLGTVKLRRYELVRDQLDYALRLHRVGASVAARDYARRAAEAAPKLPEARLLLGDLLWEAGRREQAKVEYGEYLKLAPPYRQTAERVRGRLAH